MTCSRGAVAGLAGQVAERLQDQADPVERGRDGVRPRARAGLDAGVLPLEAEGPLGRAGVLLPVGAGVAGVAPLLVAQVLDPGRDLGVGRRPAQRRGAEVDLGEPGPERRGEVAPRRRLLGREVLGHPHPAGHDRRAREVDEGEPADLAVLGHDQRTRASPSSPPPSRVAGSSTTTQPWLRPAGTRTMSPGLRASRIWVLSARRSALRSRAASASRSAISSAAPGVRLEVAAVARGRRPVGGDRLGVAGERPGQPDHGTVGLELGERLLQQRPGPRPADAADQVDGHVVGGGERRLERVGAARGEPGDGPRVEPRLPEHDRVALDVDAPAPGAPGELGVLPRRDVGVGLAVVLDQLLQHDAARRHVDAQREGLGGEDDLGQARGRSTPRRSP